MAVKKYAELIRVEHFNAATRLFEFSMVEKEPLGFLGGQYIIVDSGITLPNGRALKRPYSIFSSDAEQRRFEIAVRRVDAGLGSRFMYELSPGTVLPFSGPWGKFFPAVGEVAAPMLLVATDNGITAALGLLQGASFRTRLAHALIVWLVEPDETFLSESLVRERLPAGCANLRVAALPPRGHPERVAAARAHLEAAWSLCRPARAYLSGDGDLLYPMSDHLRVAGMADSEIIIECFFNNPAKKVA